MIPWRTIDEAIAAAVKTTSGVNDVRWKWQPAQMRAAGGAAPTPKASIDLKRSPVVRIGSDERLYDEVGDTLAAKQRGQRSFTVEIRCTSSKGSPSDTAPTDPADILSVLVTRMWRSSTHAAFRAAQCGLSTAGQIVRTDFTVDGREHGLAIVPLTFLCADVDADSDEYWIDSFAGNLVLTTPDGTEITTPFSGEVT